MNKDDKKKLKNMIDEAETIIVSTNKAGCAIGDRDELLTLLVEIMQQLRTNTDITDEDIENCVRLSKMTDEEIEEEAISKMQNWFNTMMNREENNNE